MEYMIDDGLTEQFTNSVKTANAIATKLKKTHPLRSVYISKLSVTPNGDNWNVIAEA
jgi:hypothetical protein